MGNLGILLIFFVLFALLIGSAGCFLFWNRLTDLSDALTHGSVLGAVIASRLGLPSAPTLFATSCLLGFALQWLNQMNDAGVPKQVLVTILTQPAFALGFLLSTHSDHHDHLSLLGDLQHLNWGDLLRFSFFSLLILGFFWKFWHPFLAATTQPDLAALERPHAKLYPLMLHVLLCGSIALCFPYLGGLLTVTLLIAPVACAHILAQSIAQAVGLSVMFGFCSLTLALIPACVWNCHLAVAAAIISCSLFILTLACRHFKK